MAKKRKKAEEEHVNHERWLVSYADFITLLFAFFVVMYAISSLNEGKYRVLSDSLLQAFKHDRVVTAQTTGMAPINRTSNGNPIQAPNQRPVTPIRRQEQADKKLQGLVDKLAQVLKTLVDKGQVRLTKLPRGIAVEINASVLFAPGQATLEQEAVVSLQSVATVLADVPNAVQVEGHTDNVKIASAIYPSNWELSAARASSVVRLFMANGVAPERLTVVGYAENKPVEPNDTPEHRARNRRVTLLILALGPENERTEITAPPALGTPAEAAAAAAQAAAAASPPGQKIPTPAPVAAKPGER